MATPLPDFLRMEPYLRETPWGGRRLAEQLGKRLPPHARIGESMEVSAYPGWESRVAGGCHDGRDLRGLVADYGAALLGDAVFAACEGDFPLLVKFLDAHDDLSLQVHPDDRYARAQGLGRRGKQEAWLVLHSDGGRIAYGLEGGVGRAELAQAIEREKLDSVVRFLEVRPGDVVQLPPGTVHALCRGVVVYELQQSSDLTFRIHDWGRCGADGRPRALHVARALDVIDFAAALPPPTPWWKLPGARDDEARLVDAGHFRLELHRPAQPRRHATQGSFAALTLLRGEIEIEGRDGSLRLERGASALIPAGREVTVRAVGGSAPEYLVARAA